MYTSIRIHYTPFDQEDVGPGMLCLCKYVDNIMIYLFAMSFGRGHGLWPPAHWKAASSKTFAA